MGQVERGEKRALGEIGQGAREAVVRQDEPREEHQLAQTRWYAPRKAVMRKIQDLQTADTGAS